VTLGKTREWTEQKSAEIFFPKNKQKAAEKSAAFCVVGFRYEIWNRSDFRFGFGWLFSLESLQEWKDFR
jgi:hypothetical protein